MPTDSVKNRSFKEAFNGTVRFEIPFFQRGYAWEKRQWDQLFQDINEQVIEELDRGSEIDNVEHFFGPIVVLEKSGGALELKNFLVIDGQQRITTAYLLLAVIRTELIAKKQYSDDAADYARQLSRFLVNDVVGSDDYLKLKLYSSKGDRLPTYWVVFGPNSNPITPILQTDLQLYIPATNRVDEFKKYASKKLKTQYTDVPSLWRLASIILNCLKIVWIPLVEGKDDPQAIFESLNDKGMPLKASELLCNYLFRPIIDAKQHYEDLHNTRWLAAIRIIGGDADFEEFLRNLFSIGENKMVGKGRKLYIQFKAKHRQLTSSVSREILDSIHSNAPLYMMIQNPRIYRHEDDDVTNLLTSIRDTRMDSSTPFIMSVLRSLQIGIFDLSLAKKILREVLVLLVRRKATELSTTQYDVMFPQLASKIQHESDKILALQNEFRLYGVWVSDQDFRQALVSKPTYRTKDLAFSRLLLIGVDKSFQTHGQLPDYTTVNTIEHTLPQTIDMDWSKYLGADADDERLGTITNSIGNLCLLSGPANSSAGRDPFVSKKEKYSPVTALARQIKEHPGPWNLKSITERSEVLAERACHVWSWS